MYKLVRVPERATMVDVSTEFFCPRPRSGVGPRARWKYLIRWNILYCKTSLSGSAGIFCIPVVLYLVPHCTPKKIEHPSPKCTYTQYISAAFRIGGVAQPVERCSYYPKVVRSIAGVRFLCVWKNLKFAPGGNMRSAAGGGA